MNETSPAQPSFDYRTGVSAWIAGPVVGAAERAACGRLNRKRARRILDAVKGLTPGEQATADVWLEAVAGRTAEWEIPLIPLKDLSILREEEIGGWQSDHLAALKSGQEAIPFHDRDNGVVYKLFDLKGRASLGKKLRYERPSEYGSDLVHELASLSETLEKICVLHDAGALRTEIAGIADSGDCLFVNIMLDSDGRPTIIDALTGAVPHEAVLAQPLLNEAASRAKFWRETGTLPEIRRFHDGDDSKL